MVIKLVKSVGDRVGSCKSSMAAKAETCGVAKEVPSRALQPPLLAVLVTP